MEHKFQGYATDETACPVCYSSHYDIQFEKVKNSRKGRYLIVSAECLTCRTTVKLKLKPECGGQYKEGNNAT